VGVNELRRGPLDTHRTLLEHTFYRRWVVGDLSLAELREYAGQYFHVVAALPKWLRRAAIALRNAELVDHAAEEQRHVGLWLRFAAALGLPDIVVEASQPNRVTAALLRDGDDFTREPAGLAAVWAFEIQAVQVSAEKLRGLANYYGIEAYTGGDYFDLHRSLDISHTRELEGLIGHFEPPVLLRSRQIADLMFDHQWNLLTSVEHHSSSTSPAA
jgi:pyrroloquinoline quinone (PQQ) biosynthesis protein C